MDCETLIRHLSAYLNGDLDDALTLAAEEHLASCPNCRVVARSTQAMIQAYQARGERIPTDRRRALLNLLTDRLKDGDKHESPLSGMVCKPVRCGDMPVLSRRILFFIVITIMGMAFTLPISAQDTPLPLPYSGQTPGILNRAAFEVPSDLLPLTRAPFSVTVTTTADPAITTGCNAADGMSLREALVTCSSASVQPVVYLPAGTYLLSSTIALSDRSFTVIGQSPLNTFIEGSPTNIRYFDLTMLTTNTITFANLTVRGSTSGLSGNALRAGGSGSFRFDNVRVTGNLNSTRGSVRFDVEASSRLSVSITNSEFSGNSASNGSGLAFTNELGNGVGILSISNSLFSGNLAALHGVGILVASNNGVSTSVTLDKTTLSGGQSTGGSGGGIHMSGNGDSVSLTITNSTIDANTVNGTGAGLSFNNSGGDVFLRESRVTNNTFVNSGVGAGIFINAARQVVISGSLFDNNDAKTGIGGAMDFETAVGQVSLINTRITNNKAGNVGGIYAFLVDSITANGLVVTGNTATTEVGGALLASSNFTSLTDSSFTLNTAGVELGGLSTSRATLLNVKIEDNSAPIRPDCTFDALSGTTTSLGGVGITDMTGCAGTFIPAAGDQIDNLVTNGGFEFAGATASKPAGWTLKTITGDKRACNTAITTLTPYGKCAMQFTGGVGEVATLTQLIDLTGLTFAASEELRLYAMGDGSSSKSKLQLTVTATYSDQPANKAILTFTGNHPTLTAQSQILTLTSANLTKLTLQIKHTSPSGKFLLDRVYLTR